LLGQGSAAGAGTPGARPGLAPARTSSGNTVLHLSQQPCHRDFPTDEPYHCFPVLCQTRQWFYSDSDFALDSAGILPG